MIQWSNKFKTVDKDKLLKKQNEVRKKYGLKPLKRLQTETILYLQSNNNRSIEEKCITSNNGGMYQ